MRGGTTKNIFMKTITHTFWIATLLLGMASLTVTHYATAQGDDMAAMQKAWEDFMTPGEMHKFLAKLNGSWDAEVLTYMDPSAPPTKSTAMQVNETIMGGLYQLTTFTGNMMGMPFEGRGTMGFDNSKKIFVATWIDNLGSGIIYMTGTWDEKAKTLHFKGTQTDPMTGKDSPIREELKVVNDNTHVMTMYGQGMDGKEAKFMEATFKRKK